MTYELLESPIKDPIILTPMNREYLTLIHEIKKLAGYSHRTAQPPILATFLSWGGSAGAGRVRPAAAKVRLEC